MLSLMLAVDFGTADAVGVGLAALGMAVATAVLWDPRGLTGPRSGSAVAEGMAEGGAADGRRISVIVPARNEQCSLPRLLGSLAHSNAPVHELIVVDDGSTDDTPRIAADHGATVVSPGEPPSGWAGKPWACQRGADRATGDVLVFLDADTWLEPDALGLLSEAQHAAGGLLSVQPHHRPGTLVEELSLLFNLVAVMGPGEFAPHGRSSRARVAFGPCVVCTADDYRRAGGHAAAPGAVVEDIELARSFAAADLPVSCRLGGDLVAYRMYPEGFGAIVRGWSKNIAAGAAASRPLALAASVLWIAALAAGAVRVAAGLSEWVSGGGGPWWSVAVYFALVVHLGWLAARVGRFRPTTVLLYPVPLVFFFGVFARSAVLTTTRRPVRWSGRDVPTGPVRR